MKKGLFAAWLLLASSAPFADVGIGVFSKNTIYEDGEIPQLWLSGFNNGAAPRLVDIHFGLIAPDGAVYEYPDWNRRFTPWLRSLSLPANFEFPATPIVDVDQLPGANKEGTWYVAAALTEPGTLKFLSVAVQPFSVIEQVDNDTRYGFVNLLKLSGDETGTAATGLFWKPAVTPNLLESLPSLGSPVTEFEQCSYQNVAFVGGEPGDFLNIGRQLNLRGSNGLTTTVSIDRDITNNFYFSVLSRSFVTDGTNYTFSSNGGDDLSAFSVTTTAPETLILSDPTGGDHSVSSDLDLKWNGNNGQGEVVAQLTGEGSSGSLAIACRFSDDGEATVPAELLAQLRSDLASTNDGVPLVVFRANTTPFNTAEAELATGAFSIASGTFRMLRLRR